VLEKATTSQPILDANWRLLACNSPVSQSAHSRWHTRTAKCPSPPIPTTPTQSVGFAPQVSCTVKTVAPAHIIGAAFSSESCRWLRRFLQILPRRYIRHGARFPSRRASLLSGRTRSDISERYLPNESAHALEPAQSVRPLLHSSATRKLP